MRGSLKTVAIRIPEKGKERRGRKEGEKEKRRREGERKEREIKEWRRKEGRFYRQVSHTKQYKTKTVCRQ
jgi:hypothetical protein